MKPSDPAPPPRVTVVGAGTMGHGIAYVAALAGCPVTLSDTQPGALDLARSKIDGLVAGGVSRGKLPAEQAAAVRERVRTETDYPAGWAMTQVNLGLAYRDLPTGDRSANLRRAILLQLDQLSGLSPDELLEQRYDRFRKFGTPGRQPSLPPIAAPIGET